MRTRTKPLLIFDGDCGFCKRWVIRAQQWTRNQIDFEPFQKVGFEYSHISPIQFEKSIWLIDVDGKSYCAADAAFRILQYASGKKWFHTLYERSSIFKRLSEWMYEKVAIHRQTLSRWESFLIEPPETKHHLVSWGFLRWIGVIYFFAFTSLYSQLPGLIGSDGILPIRSMLQAIHQSGYGLFSFPTILWFHPSDNFVQLTCALGIVASLLIVFDIFSTSAFILSWICYLSLSTAGMDFLSFQWDALLLETGFLCIFLSAFPLSKSIRWLLYFLLFRLMFSSGIVKLASGDPTWKNFTALDYHFETQPLPTWIGYYFHWLPMWIHHACTIGMFFIELIVPFFIFPKRTRAMACGLIILLQIIIFMTGNYAFFNLLTIGLCWLLQDDARIEKHIPSILRTYSKRHPRLLIPSWLSKSLTVAILILSLFHIVSLFTNAQQTFPTWSNRLVQAVEPYRIVNSYGLFAVMTTQRKEIVIEGSDDGYDWRPYEFRYKPQDPRKKPDFIAPFQPRLDWQMWFAALSSAEQNPWLGNLCIRLLQGSPTVLHLLSTNPFPNHPPQQIRASIYEYHFADLSTHRKETIWWTSQLIGPYTENISR